MLACTLSCRHCSWRTTCGSAELANRLRLVGHLRRDKDPPDELLLQLAPEAAGRMTCPICKEIGLSFSEADAEEQFNEADWQAAILCEVCREPIPPERLEVMPDSRRCVACQGKAESGTLEEDEPEFCPRCGSLVELRVSTRGGLTHYRRFCTGTPACRL